MTSAATRAAAWGSVGQSVVAVPDYLTRWGTAAAFQYKLDEASGSALGTYGPDLTIPGGAPTATAGKVGGARDTTPGRFAHADAAAFTFGNEDFWIALWFRAAATGGSQGLVSHDGAAGGYHLRFSTEVTWIVRQASGADCGRVASSALGAAAPHFAIVYFDALNSLVGVSVNGGAWATAATAGVPVNAGNPFALGDNSQGGEPFAGWLDHVVAGRPVQPALGIGVLRNEIRDGLWAGGAGADLP